MTDNDSQQLIGVEALAALFDAHRDAGSALFDACKAELFPCDILGFAILNRSLTQLKSFKVLMENGGYVCGAALLRMQLDNILRFNGVVAMHDPHETAYRVLSGESLRNIKNNAGKRMNDAVLISMLASRNPWLRGVYDLASGYIHLSMQHVQHFLSRSKTHDDGTRDIVIGDEDDEVSNGHKRELVEAFAVATRGVLAVVTQWSTWRHQHGDAEVLRKRFG